MAKNRHGIRYDDQAETDDLLPCGEVKQGRRSVGDDEGGGRGTWRACWKARAPSHRAAGVLVLLLLTLLCFHGLVSAHTRKTSDPGGKVLQTGIAGPWVTHGHTAEDNPIYLPQAVVDLPEYSNLTFNEWSQADWQAEKSATRSNLAARQWCTKMGTCKANQDQVILLTDHDFIEAARGTQFAGGEGIWARSLLSSLRSEGYTLLYFEWANLTTIKGYVNRELEGWKNVKAVIANVKTVEECSAEWKCYYSSDKNPDGLPVWKLLSFFFWNQARHPLGSYYVLQPEPYDWLPSQSRYVGYSIERACMKVGKIEAKYRFGSRTKEVMTRIAGSNIGEWRAWTSSMLEKRIVEITGDQKSRRRSAYILAKHLSYFSSTSAFGQEQFEAAYKRYGILFEHGSRNDTEPEPYVKDKDMFLDHKRLEPKPFMQIVSSSSILIGIGRPELSPSPYDALCLGVPFLNPIISWDRTAPKKRDRWVTQHDGLKHLDPPYVYHVLAGDTEAFVDAIGMALQRPIGSTIIPRMRQMEVDQRVKAIMSSNFKGHARWLYLKCTASFWRKTRCYEV